MKRPELLGWLGLLLLVGLGVDVFLGAWLEAGLEMSLAAPDLDAAAARHLDEHGRNDLGRTRERSRLVLLAALAASLAILIWRDRRTLEKTPPPAGAPEPLFSSQIADPLRAPLESLRQLADAAPSPEDPAAVKAFFAAIHRRALEMERTIAELLAQARREGGLGMFSRNSGFLRSSSGSISTMTSSNDGARPNASADQP